MQNDLEQMWDEARSLAVIGEGASDPAVGEVVETYLDLIGHVYAAVKREDLHTIGQWYAVYEHTSDEGLDFYPEGVFRQIAKTVVATANAMGYKIALGKRKPLGMPFWNIDRPEGAPNHAYFMTVGDGFIGMRIANQAVYVWKEIENVKD